MAAGGSPCCPALAIAGSDPSQNNGAFLLSTTAHDAVIGAAEEGHCRHRRGALRESF